MITKESSKPNPPAWLTQLPKRAGYAYAVGIKSGAKSLEEAKEGAHQNAAVQMSNVVGTKIQSAAESRQDTEGTNFASEEVRAQTAGLMRDLEMMDEYYEKSTKIVGSYFNESYTLWVLTRFPLHTVEQERKRQAAEEAEGVYDSFKRYQNAQEELKAGNEQEAWALLLEITKQLRSVDKLTPLDRGGYDTASDLLRDADKDLRHLDTKSRSVTMRLDASDRLGQGIESNFQSELADGLSSQGMRLSTSAPARFTLTIRYSTTVSNRKLYGKTVVYMSYAATTLDNWSGTMLPATRGEVKGFGKGKKAAAGAASKEAIDFITKSVIKHIQVALRKETG